MKVRRLTLGATSTPTPGRCPRRLSLRRIESRCVGEWRLTGFLPVASWPSKTRWDPLARQSLSFAPPLPLRRKVSYLNQTALGPSDERATADGLVILNGDITHPWRVIANGREQRSGGLAILLQNLRELAQRLLRLAAPVALH